MKNNYNSCFPRWIIENLKLALFPWYIYKEVKKYFNDKVYKTVIPRNVKLSEAPSYGMPITEYDPRSKGAKSYMKFAKEFLKINDEQKKAKHMM